MKEKLTLRNAIICGAATLGFLFFCFSFLGGAQMRFSTGGYSAEYIFRNAIWSGGYVIGKANGAVVVEGPCTGAPTALPIIGIILVLLSALGAAAIAFFIKDEKIKKISLIGAGVLSVVGGVFVFFVGETAIKTFWALNEAPMPFEEFKEVYKSVGASWGPRAFTVIIGVIGILCGCAYGVSQFVPDKKLVK